VFVCGTMFRGIPRVYKYVEQYVNTTFICIDLSTTLSTPITLLCGGTHDKYNPIHASERYVSFLMLSNATTLEASHFDVFTKSNQGRFLFQELSEEIQNLLVNEKYSSKGVVDLFKMYK